MAAMSRENVALVAALVVGVIIVVSIHAGAYVLAKKRLMLVKGEGTLVNSEIRQVGRRMIFYAVAGSAAWILGIGAAKALLVGARRRGSKGQRPGAPGGGSQSSGSEREGDRPREGPTRARGDGTP